jgi:hypothetical protein
MSTGRSSIDFRTYSSVDAANKIIGFIVLAIVRRALEQVAYATAAET